MASLKDSSDDHVLVEVKSSLRKLTLNRPKQLNVITFAMGSRVLDIFAECAKDSSVKLIIIKGKGRAFCAGGDVAAVLRDISQGNWRSGEVIYRKAYTVNYVIATYIKPLVSIVNGLVMGGGASAAIYGTFQVVTENTLFAMPETALGSFPDLGASYYLSRLPGFFGEYLGLTGARLDGAEMFACGLATHFVPSEKLSLLEEALENVDSSDPFVISSTISKFSEVPNLTEKSAYNRLNTINKCFSQRTVEEIVAALEKEAVDNKEDWISFSIKSLKKASPTSLKITLRSIREGRLQGIGQCFVREFRMICHVLQGETSNDFYEGCRAILLDKDRKPKSPLVNKEERKFVVAANTRHLTSNKGHEKSLGGFKIQFNKLLIILLL
ncbi:hypothetical protein ACJIZ3_016470 [Penstemon smallii]|uniref:3-hydroxyisobutyryl-CoA hydrolase n=1 Tax=Penstemon smallii TaxID=265156 RepID=A0ABD3RQH8_9LAMI